MELELLNYKTSFLNPLFKWIAPVLFVFALALFIKASANYGGVFKAAMKLLVASVLIGVLAFFFRVGGDVILPNFKWGESVFFLIFVIFNIFVALKFLNVIKEFKSNV